MIKKFVKITGLHNIFNVSDSDLDITSIKEEMQSEISQNSILFLTASEDASYGYPDGNKYIWTMGTLYPTNGGELATTDDVTSKTDVGYVKPGTTIPEGTTLQQLVNMIFTKIRGLQGATPSSVALNGVQGNTHEIGEKINVALSATYTDGSWTNEEHWGTGKQAYQSSAISYIFKLNNVETTNGVYNNYEVLSSNNARVDVNHTASTVIPKNEVGTDLIKGSVNDTEHYIEFKEEDSVYKTASFTGYYRYWIGNSAVSPNDINREIINSASFNKVCLDLAKSNTITCNNTCVAELGEYMYIIVPSEYSLTKVLGAVTDIPLDTFIADENKTNIGLDEEKTYTIYHNYNADAGDGLKAVSITITKK